MQYFEGFFYLQATVKLEFQRSQSFLSKIIFSFQWQLQASASLFTLRIKHSAGNNILSDTETHQLDNMISSARS